MSVVLQIIFGSARPLYTPSGEDARLLAEVGLGEAERVFDHPQIRAWRTLADRENATLDATLSDGRPIRLHIKRYAPRRGPGLSPAEREARGAMLLDRAGIPTLRLVGWGVLPDGRSFTAAADLAGYTAADKLIEAGTVGFDALLEPTADLAAALHDAGLHHRDLYLCHFFAKAEQGQITDIRLIDVARVGLLGVLLARRWIIKDLGQFIFSTHALGVSDAQRDSWLARYAMRRGLGDVARLRRAIDRKVSWIARHDRRLRDRQPGRNISIP
jgi:hypothetical protein